MTLLRRLVLTLPVALLVSATALAVFFVTEGEFESAARVHEWGLSVLLFVLTVVGVMISAGVETGAGLRALRVRSRGHVFLVLNLGLAALAIGAGAEVLYAWALHGRLPNLDARATTDVFTTGASLWIWPNLSAAAAFSMYGFAPGPVWRSGRGYVGKGQPWGCTINAVMFALLALGAAWVPVPFLVPGLLLVAYGVLLARAGILEAPPKL